LSLKNKLIKFLSAKEKTDGILIFLLFFPGLYLAYDINFNNPQFAFPKIVSDKADYYAYLPATFIYGWDIHKFPAGIEKKCQGFHLDYKRNKLEDKTTCGVAILWAPFFLVTHFLAVQWDLQPDGFSDFYQKMTILPGVFYLVLGLFFLLKFLQKYYSRGISWITIFLIFAGTNLYYFGIVDGLMSHVNSFFLFSLFLYLLKKFLDQEKKSFGLFAGISFVISLAILIRPTNILLFTWMIFLDIISLKAIWTRILLFLKPAYIMAFLVIFFIVFLPQLIYWKYLTGNFLYYSYPGEGFVNWKNPQMIPVWFAPLNGFFLYTPLALLFIAGIVIMVLKKIPNGIFIGLFFLLITYIFASWHIWHFGGSFGYRPFVEYYAILALPFGYFLCLLRSLKNLYIRSLLIIFIVISSYYNLRLTYRQQWNPYSVWSWDDYLIHLDYAGLYHFPRNSYTYIQDFENMASIDELPVRDCVHSPTLAGYVDRLVEYNGKFSRRLNDILHRPVRRVIASIWVNPGKKIKTNVCFVCKIEDDRQKRFYYKEIKVDDFIKMPDKWTKAYGTFDIPEWINQSAIITCVTWNPARSSTVHIDDIKLRFE
jgi:hypothetical protein